MTQRCLPDDYVLATNASCNVKEFSWMSFEAVNRNLEKYVKLDPRYLRPTDGDSLIGDYLKAENASG